MDAANGAVRSGAALTTPTWKRGSSWARVPNMRSATTRCMSLVGAVVALAAGTITAGLVGPAQHFAPDAHDRAGLYAGSRLSRLPLTAQAPISAALGADQPAYGVNAAATGLHADNPAQDLRATFTRSGVLVGSGTTRLGSASPRSVMAAHFETRGSSLRARAATKPSMTTQGCVSGMRTAPSGSSRASPSRKRPAGPRPGHSRSRWRCPPTVVSHSPRVDGPSRSAAVTGIVFAMAASVRPTIVVARFTVGSN